MLTVCGARAEPDRRIRQTSNTGGTDARPAPPGRRRVRRRRQVHPGRTPAATTPSRSWLTSSRLSTRVSRSRAVPALDLALLTDGLRAEREQGITIDVAYRYFATPRRVSSSWPIRRVTCSTPATLVTGASTADAGGDPGRRPQRRGRRRPAGTRAVVGFARRAAFDLRGEQDGCGRLGRGACSAGLPPTLGASPSRWAVLTSRCCRSRPNWGERRRPRAVLVRRAGAAAAARIVGSCGLRRAGTVPPSRAVGHPAAHRRAPRLPRAGRSESSPGAVSVGDSRRRAALRTHVDGERNRHPDGPVEMAVSGQSVTVHLSDELDVSRGDGVLAHPAGGTPGVDGARRHCLLRWLLRPVGPTSASWSRRARAAVKAVLAAPGDVWDVQTQRWVPGGSALTLNEIGHVSLRLAQPVAVDDLRGRPWHRCLSGDRPSHRRDAGRGHGR